MSDALVAPVWLLMTLLLVASSWRAARRLFGEDSLFAQVRHTTVLSWTAIVVASIGLGLCELLTPTALLIAVTAISIGYLYFGAFAGLPINAASQADSQLPQIRVSHEPGERPWHWMWLSLLAITSAELVFNGLLTFPSGWDSLNYHLPIIHQWLRVRGLYAPDQATWFVPGNNELLGLWIVAPFSGDFLISLINLPCAILLAVSAVELGRSVGLSVFYRHLWALAIIGSVPVLRQLLDPKNDIAVCALFMATLCYGLNWIRTDRRADLAFAGLSLGLLVGVKYYAVGYGVLAWAGLTLAAWKLRGRPDAFRWALLTGALATLLGGYWYARNTWLTGTPFFPKGFTQNTDLVGEMRSQASNVWRTTLLGNENPAVFYLLLNALWRMSGPCQWLAFVLAPCTIAWGLGSGVWLHRNEPGPSGFARLLLTAGIVATGLIWGFTPFGVESAPGTLDMLRGGYLPSRFGFCFLSLALLGLLILVQDGTSALARWLGSETTDEPLRRGANWQGRIIPSLQVVLAGAVAWQVGYILLRETKEKFVVESLLLAVNIVLALILLAAIWRAWPAQRRLLGAGVAIFGMGILYFAVPALATRWHDRFPAFYDQHYKSQMFVPLSRLDPDATRFCVLDYRIYPFMGSNRQYRVAQPLWLPTYDRMLEYLHEHDATIVVVKESDTQGVRRYDGKLEWLQEHPKIFEPMYNDFSYYFFRVDRRSLEQALTSR